MKCPKCGNENNDTSKFCKHCGEKLETSNEGNKRTKNDKIIIALIAVIAILIIGLGIIASGVLTPVNYETQSFNGFKLDVPAGETYLLDESSTANPDNVFFGYINKDKTYTDALAFQVGNNITPRVIFGDFQYQEGDIKIYKNESDGMVLYIIFKETPKGSILLYGSNEEMLKHMGNSFECDDLSKLATASTQSTSSSQTSSAPASSSITILGGSFTTGSAEEDKTYARINVGTQNAGKSVVVQIYYSRDGNNLNNGNMVPATVHSDGYLEITSADAYHYYPDHATINIYDTSNNLLTTKSVNLAPTSGTQTF